MVVVPTGSDTPFLVISRERERVVGNMISKMDQWNHWNGLATASGSELDCLDPHRDVGSQASQASHSLPLHIFRLSITPTRLPTRSTKQQLFLWTLDESRSITLSVLDDKGVSVINLKDVVVSPGSQPYITSLQLEETYKLLLVKRTAQAEPRSVTFQFA